MWSHLIFCTTNEQKAVTAPPRATSYVHAPGRQGARQVSQGATSSLRMFIGEKPRWLMLLSLPATNTQSSRQRWGRKMIIQPTVDRPMSRHREQSFIGNSTYRFPSDTYSDVSCVHRAQDTYPDVFQAYPVYLPASSTQVTYSTYSECIRTLRSRYIHGYIYDTCVGHVIPDTHPIHPRYIGYNRDTPQQPQYTAIRCGYMYNTYFRKIRPEIHL